MMRKGRLMPKSLHGSEQEDVRLTRPAQNAMMKPR
jgi:hypothetical protein